MVGPSVAAATLRAPRASSPEVQRSKSLGKAGGLSELVVQHRSGFRTRPQRLRRRLERLRDLWTHPAALSPRRSGKSSDVPGPATPMPDQCPPPTSDRLSKRTSPCNCGHEFGRSAPSLPTRARADVSSSIPTVHTCSAWPRRPALKEVRSPQRNSVKTL